ncbi:MAG: hypothetical protein CVV64_08565 [Candidatus Wallbacteria bacterium HGW-Wallbacteria-1]|jgi:Zn-dependent protease|uniref:Peptidase M50 domain-containing protein n=1 Tax=Candidatus Wallbacteria bacterium HGW-Wallbacteria-1 TaxID=2013854 RepID=A0A2N1PPZ4_9BACT|nr:MAG: hypothetical protein CVV64_08565 [Candidatus Wallbacteria bacterium HGW-Wallbacteria-1]
MTFLQRLVSINGKNQIIRIATIVLVASLVDFSVRYWNNLGLASIDRFCFYLCVMLFVGLHEFSHAMTAYLLGDISQKKRGRLTLNPLNHLEPLGMISFLMMGVGWGRAVETGVWFKKHPRLYDFIITIMGPISNLAAAVVSVMMMGYFLKSGLVQAVEPGAVLNPWVIIQIFMVQAIQVNAMLFILNIIPIPPLDGGKALLTMIRGNQNGRAGEVFTTEGLIILAILFLFADLGGAISSGTLALQNLLISLLF